MCSFIQTHSAWRGCLYTPRHTARSLGWRPANPAKTRYIRVVGGRLHGQPLPKRRSVSTTLRLVWGITPFATRPHTAPCGAPLPAVFGIPQPVHLASALPALGRCLLRRVGVPQTPHKSGVVCVMCARCPHAEGCTSCAGLAHARARCSMRGVIIFFTTPRPPQGGGANRVIRAAKSLRFILHS